MTGGAPEPREKRERRVLLFAPTGRDAELMANVLGKANVGCHVCHSDVEFFDEMDQGAGALLVTQEALDEDRQLLLAARLSAQPPWSDLSLVLLTVRGGDTPAIGSAIRALGNLTLLERPLRAWVLVSIIKSALRARARQYELRDQFAELGRLVDALREAESSLIEADRRKDEFLASLAHELRNPLAPIRNSVGLLRMVKSEDRLVAVAREVIDRQVLQLTRLVDDLLDLSRITRGVVSLRRTHIVLADALRTAVETAEPGLREARVTLSYEPPPPDLVLEADPVRITQAVSNILTNAAKFTTAGGSVRLWTEILPAEVVIRIRDTGIGIRPEMLGRIFDLFVQEERGIERSRSGLGIGLTIVRKFIEMHGGSVEARSDGPGTGSEFLLRLPRPSTDAPDAGPSAPEASARTFSGQPTVLIVDDNRDNAATMCELVRAAGCNPSVAHDGLTALAHVRRDMPEVMLLDIGMPGMDGFELARRVRSRPEGQSCVLIAMTGWGREDFRHRSLESGFDHFLVKPVDFAKLKPLLFWSRPSRTPAAR